MVQAETPHFCFWQRGTRWTSTVKPFPGFPSKKPANPHEYKKKWRDIFFVTPSWSWWTDLNPRPADYKQYLLLFDRLVFIFSDLIYFILIDTGLPNNRLILCIGLLF